MATTKTLVIVPATAALLLLFLSFSMTANAVVDTDGKPINEKSEYYIQPVGIGFLGGLGRSPRSDSVNGCPLYVTESDSESDRGEAVKFYIDDGGKKTQNPMMASSEGHAYYINSGTSGLCRSHGYWYAGIDALTRRFVFFGTGASQDTWLTGFLMKKVQTSAGITAYKMFFCLGNEPSDCGYVARFNDPISGLKMLTMATDSEAPLHVVFIKKRDHKTPSSVADN